MNNGGMAKGGEEYFEQEKETALVPFVRLKSASAKGLCRLAR